MTQVPTEKELQDFVLRFDKDIVKPLVDAGFEKYNIFDILNISRQELRHSDFLAFLLDPNRSGNIGYQFLRNFLTLLSKDIIPQLNFFKMYYGNIEKVTVSREVVAKDGRIDILIDIETFKEEKEKIVIAIENKVDTGEHDNQLTKYKTFLTSKYKNYNHKIMLFLSPDKTTQSDSEWIAIDYGFIYSVIDSVNIGSADITIKTLVNDYKNKIRREFQLINDDELRQQAIEIYKNEYNRKVLDFIFNCKPDWIKETANIIRAFLKEQGAELESESQNVNIAFKTKELANYKGFYFQISVVEMSLLFIDNVGKRVIPKQWLFGDSQESAKAVQRFQELVFEPTELKSACEQILKQTFQQNGIIAQCITSLKMPKLIQTE